MIFQFFQYFVWRRITDEGSVPEMHLWSVLLIKSAFKMLYMYMSFIEVYFCICRLTLVVCLSTCNRILFCYSLHTLETIIVNFIQRSNTSSEISDNVINGENTITKRPSACKGCHDTGKTDCDILRYYLYRINNELELNRRNNSTYLEGPLGPERG